MKISRVALMSSYHRLTCHWIGIWITSSARLSKLVQGPLESMCSVGLHHLFRPIGSTYANIIWRTLDPLGNFLSSDPGTTRYEATGDLRDMDTIPTIPMSSDNRSAGKQLPFRESRHPVPEQEIWSCDHLPIIQQPQSIHSGHSDEWLGPLLSGHTDVLSHEIVCSTLTIIC